MIADQLAVQVNLADRAGLVTLSGELDLGTARLVTEAVKLCLCNEARTISVDLSGLVFCDCAGLNAFDQAERLVAAAGGEFHLLAPSRPVARLLAMLNKAGTATGGIFGSPDGGPPGQGEKAP